MGRCVYSGEKSRQTMCRLERNSTEDCLLSPSATSITKALTGAAHSSNYFCYYTPTYHYTDSARLNHIYVYTYPFDCTYVRFSVLFRHLRQLYRLRKHSLLFENFSTNSIISNSILTPHFCVCVQRILLQLPLSLLLLLLL